MNTEDFKPYKFNKATFMNEIFEKQKELFDEYLSFEYKKIDYSDFDINIYEDQVIFKDFLEKRFIEELTEATADLKNKNHFLEEIIDAFNFLIETYIIYGWTIDEIYFKSEPVRIFGGETKFENCILQYHTNDIKLKMYDLVQITCNTCNYLKNRPWKQTQYLVDLIPFERDLKEIFIQFNEFCNMLGITDRILYEVWSLKYQVNKYRIATNY